MDIKRYRYIGFNIKYQQIGGGSELLKMDSTLSKYILNKLINQTKKGSIPYSDIRAFEASLTQFYRQFNDVELSKEIETFDPPASLSGGLQLYSNLFNKDTHGIDISFVTIPEVHKKLIEKLNITSKRSCSVEEFMEQPKDFIDVTCNNRELVKGSCGDPNFFLSIGSQINNADEIITFLELLQKLYPLKTKLIIVLGSHNFPYVGNDSSICLYFNNIEGYIPINKYIDEMREGITDHTYLIKSFFPLETFGEDKKVLDKISELNEHYAITIYNRICGSCFRSLYYLVNNPRGSMMYIVNPEQTLGVHDTPEIINCFKK
jgi:hypothetical protein